MITGNTYQLKVGQTTLTNLSNEQQSQMTFTQDFVQGAGKARGTSNRKTIHGWNIECQLLFTYADFVRLFNYMKQGQKPTLSFADKDGRFSCRGSVVITSLSFAGQGRGLVHLNLSAIGDGKPTIIN